nr:accessory Sec system S-layer assembly protein [Lysinibacillus timonensis]
MGLFDFFKKTDKVGQDSAIDSSKLTGNTEETNNESKVTTKLSYHPDWDVPQEQKYIFNFLANELEPLLPNQLSLAAIDIDVDPFDGAWNVKAFFRNSLPNTIELGEMGLLIIDKDGRQVASQKFDFKEIGTLPPESARPWVFRFDRKHIHVKDKPEDGWKIAFNLVALRGHQLELDETWKKQLSQEQIELLEKAVKEMPKLSDTEVNFTGFQLKLQDNQNLVVSLFIRNGNDRAINIEQLPLEIVDANGKQVAKGYFRLDPALSVQPNSTKPWTFIFPAENVKAEGADLTRWSARVINK